MNSEKILQVKGLCKTYSQGASKLNVLENFDFDVAKGECVAVLGTSGSGKSTLLNLCGGLDNPDSGEVSVCGAKWRELDSSQRAIWRNKHVGFVYQFHHLLGEFTALENVAMPALIGDFTAMEAARRAEEILEQTGLKHRLNHKPAELSGGERQRVAIARALVMTPSLVLMDEPTGNLDGATGDSVLDLLLNLNRTMNISFVVVTHDMTIASRMDRSVSLDSGVKYSEAHLV